MRPGTHRGREIRRCRKKKCQKTTPRWVSVYFHQQGPTRIAVRCMCVVPDNQSKSACVTHSLDHIFTLPLMHIDRHLCIRVMSLVGVTHRPIGGNRAVETDSQHATSVRIQAEIAMCFAWGTAMHSHAWNSRRPLCRCKLQSNSDLMTASIVICTVRYPSY